MPEIRYIYYAIILSGFGAFCRIKILQHFNFFEKPAKKKAGIRSFT